MRTSANRLWWATLHPGSPRYPVWRSILATEDVPLRSPMPVRADLGEPPREKDVECYEVAVDELLPEQRERLVRYVVQRWAAPAKEVEHDLDSRGFPIRAADVIVAFSMRAFM